MRPDKIREEIHKCMKCGFCMAVCPIYKELELESVVARGKVALMGSVEKGELSLTPLLAQKMDLCLMCMACEENCPCGVSVHEVVLYARARLVEERGLSFIKKAIFRVGLKQRWTLPLVSKVASIFQGLGFKRHPERYGMYPRFPIGLDRGRIVPPFAKRPLRALFPEENGVGGKVRVGFFTGCTMNYMYTHSGTALVRVLNANGVDVVIPRRQQCCGMPVMVYGDLETARALAMENIKVFEEAKVDYIVTGCASCGSMLKHHYSLLVDEGGEMAEKVETFASKVRDISEFLVENGYKAGTNPVRRKVTIHDPCHLKRGQGIQRELREILSSIPGLEVIEMKEPGRCCGGAGSFNIGHYDLSMKINEVKVRDIAGTGADAVVTGCPACMMQLSDGLNRAGRKEDVLHIMEVLNESYSGGGRG